MRAPLSEEVPATAEQISFAQVIVGQALKSQRPFGELAQTITGLPGGLEFTGTPEQLADLVEEWAGTSRQGDRACARAREPVVG